MWGFGGNVSFGYYAFLEYVCRPDVVLGDDVPSETKAYVQTTRAIKRKGGEMKKIGKRFFIYGCASTSTF
jgi:hypothetical protein